MALEFEKKFPKILAYNLARKFWHKISNKIFRNLRQKISGFFSEIMALGFGKIFQSFWHKISAKIFQLFWHTFF